MVRGAYITLPCYASFSGSFLLIVHGFNALFVYFIFQSFICTYIHLSNKILVLTLKSVVSYFSCSTLLSTSSVYCNSVKMSSTIL